MKTTRPSAALLAAIKTYVDCFRSPYMGLAVVRRLEEEGFYTEILGNARSLDTQEAADRAARRYLPDGYAARTSARNAQFVRAFAA